MIISVDYRIKSHVATHFRQWATKLLREYIVKGFAMNDARLEQATPGVSREMLRRVLRQQKGKSVECIGRGPGAKWIKKG